MVCLVPQGMQMPMGVIPAQPMQMLWMTTLPAESTTSFWPLPVQLSGEPHLAMSTGSFSTHALGYTLGDNDVSAPAQFQMGVADGPLCQTSMQHAWPNAWSNDCERVQIAASPCLTSADYRTSDALTGASVNSSQDYVVELRHGNLRRRQGPNPVPAPTVGELAAPDEASDADEGKDEQGNRGSADADLVEVRRLGQLLLDRLASDDPAERQAAVASFAQMSFADKDSCRVAQEALSMAPPRAAIMLSDGLRGQIWQAVQCKFANYVVQRVVEVLPAHRSSFIAEELRGRGVEAARHRFGCRILCRIVEHTAFSDGQSPAEALIAEVLSEMKLVLRHTYGGYVVRHILEFGPCHLRGVIVHELSTDIYRSSRNKQGSRTIEAALNLCSQDDRRKLVSSFLADADQFLRSAAHQFGSKSVDALLTAGVDDSGRAAELLLQATDRLQASKYGRHILAAAAPNR
jgi:hypothetical protein